MPLGSFPWRICGSLPFRSFPWRICGNRWVAIAIFIIAIGILVGMHQINLKDYPVINYLGIDLLSKDHALFANSFGETLFHELLLPLCVIGKRSSAGQWIIDKEGLDVDL